MKNNTWINTLHDFSHKIYFYCWKKLRKHVFSPRVGLTTCNVLSTYEFTFWIILYIRRLCRKAWCGWKRMLRHAWVISTVICFQLILLVLGCLILELPITVWSTSTARFRHLLLSRELALLHIDNLRISIVAAFPLIWHFSPTMEWSQGST